MKSEIITRKEAGRTGPQHTPHSMEEVEERSQKIANHHYLKQTKGGGELALGFKETRFTPQNKKSKVPQKR